MYPTLPPSRCVHDRTRKRSSSTIPLNGDGNPSAVGSYRLPRTGGGVPSARCSKESYVSLHPEYTYGGFLSKKASGVMAGISGGRRIAPCPHSFEHYLDYASMPPHAGSYRHIY